MSNQDRGCVSLATSLATRHLGNQIDGCKIASKLVEKRRCDRGKNGRSKWVDQLRVGRSTSFKYKW